MGAFKIIDPGRAVAVHEVHHPFRALAVIAPPPVWTPCLRFVVGQVQPVDQCGRERRLVQQMEIHRRIHRRLQRSQCVGRRVLVNDKFEPAGPISGNLLDGKRHSAVFRLQLAGICDGVMRKAG